MMAWVIEQNKAVRFYLHMGGVPFAQMNKTIGGAELSEIAIGWTWN
ncbi:hypothetical protein [Paenibacillus protaetiae]|nr:hypothetical protein [Paenibacillus protaetiae]